MNLREARALLVAYRAGREDAHDPRIAQALEIARADPESRVWLAQQREFHAAMERAFREIPPPQDLRDRILAQAKTIPLPAWYRSPMLAAVAIVILLAALSALWFGQPSEDSLDRFRSRMARSVLRQYNMDLVTNDAAQIRQFLASRQAPADYVLPPALARLPMVGAGVLSWQGQRVSMVCLKDPSRGMLFLFVADNPGRRSLPVNRQFVPVSTLMTASWNEGKTLYLLVGEGSKTALQQYLQ